jgi:hypothetical protein
MKIETGSRTLTKFDVNAHPLCNCSLCTVGKDLRTTAKLLFDDSCTKLNLTTEEIDDRDLGNLAFARAEIEGNKFEIAAHTRINDDSPTWLPKTDLKTHFEFLKVNFHRELNTGSNRHNDSETRILIALDLVLQEKGLNNDCEGVVDLYTYREPCLSCDYVMIQFLKTYTNLTLNIYYEEHYPKNPKIHAGGII